MEEVNNQTPLENTPVENTQVITELQSPPLEKKRNILIPILLIVIFILLSIFAYLFFTDRVDIEDKDSSAKEEVEEDETEGEEEEIMTEEYINTEFGVKFEYPKNWKLEATSKCKPGECKDLYVSISENSDSDFFFSYYLPAGSGPDICYFSYSGMSDESGMPDEIGMGTIYETFDNIDERGILRRTFVINEGPNGPVQEYKVCKLDSNGIYTDWVEAGYINYNVNMGRADAQDIIKLMDRITLSFEYTGEEF